MIVYVVKVRVKAGCEADFKAATQKNHRETLKEPGNLRFDVLRSKEEEGLFTLYEVYRSEEAVAAHKETAHYLEWRKMVEPWMARKREGTKFEALFPEEESLW